MGQSPSKFLYAVPISTTEPEGETPIYRYPKYKDELVKTIHGDESVKTMKDAFLAAFKKFAKYNFHGTRVKRADGTFGEYKWKTYEEVSRIVHNIGYAIHHLNLSPPIKEYQDIEFRPIAVYSKNREEWCQLEYASSLFGYCLVPLYDTLGPEAVQYICNQTNLPTVFCANVYVQKLVDLKKNGKLQGITSIVSFDDYPEEQKGLCESVGIKLYSWKELQEIGEKVTVKPDYADVKPNDLYTICYTSGTTGDPKGAMITHLNMVSAIAGVAAIPDYALSTNDVHLSFLPLAHIMERIVSAYAVTQGVSIGFYNGDILKLRDDLQTLRPTILVMVPRLLNRMYALFWENINKTTGLKRKLIDIAIKTKLENLQKYDAYTHGIYDRLIFNKMKAVFGGRVRWMLTGSAPIDPAVMDFLRIAACCRIIGGYGQTESIAASFVCRLEDHTKGLAGGVLPSFEFKLEDVPELNYTSKYVNEQGERRPRGEICMRGYSIFAGYYKNPEKTAEAIDKDGWLHSGDIGELLPNGGIKIIDRKKNIFKLSQGEYVAPEKVENIMALSKYVAEPFVHGDSLQNYVVGIVFPQETAIKQLAQDLGIEGTFEELCKNEKIIEQVLADITKVCKEKGLNSFEIIKKLHLIPYSFATKDLVTPSMKLKRHEAKDVYAEEIKRMYSSGSE